MGYRNFTDRQGRKWEIRERTKSEWELMPLGDNRERMRMVKAPGYERDPFELSIEELQRLVDEPAAADRSKPSKNPFKD
jgi:hypothetical protein